MKTNEKNKLKIKQCKVCSPYVYYDTKVISPYIRSSISKGDAGYFLNELLFKTQPYGAATIDYKDKTVCCAGESCRSMDSFKKNVVLLKNASYDEVVDVLEKLKERGYLWYVIEYAKNGAPLVHYFLLNYPHKDRVKFDITSIDELKKFVNFKISTNEWIRTGIFNYGTKEIKIDKLSKYAFGDTPIRSIFNAKADEKIPISKELFRNRTNPLFSDSVEKTLFKDSDGFEIYFVEENVVLKTEIIPMDEGEAFFDLLSCTVFRDVDNPISYLAPSFIIDGEFIFTYEFFDKRWNWKNVDRVEAFFEKHKSFFNRVDVLGGEGFVLFSNKYSEIDVEPIFPGHKHFQKLFEEIIPSNITEKNELNVFVEKNKSAFVEKYFYLGVLCPDGDAKSYFNDYIFQMSKNYKKIKAEQEMK